MRCMLLVYPDGFDKAGPEFAPPPEAMAAMMKFNEELQSAGVLLSLDGLHPPLMGARVTFSAGERTVRRGPFPDVKEALGGYWMIRAHSHDEAIEWMMRCPLHGDGVVEVRQVFEMDEFPEDVRAAAGDTPARLKEALQHRVR
jgi:hypothetical protein